MIFTDRSRFLSQANCPRERFLGYHLFGRGIQRRSVALALETGASAHLAVETILKHESPTSVAALEQGLLKAVKYWQDDAKETSPYGGNESVDYLVTEQLYLICGMVAAWAERLLPTFLQDFEPIYIEQEIYVILGCDCGLSGTGEIELHLQRSCNGICLMSRPDIIARKYSTGSYSYHEIKTTYSVTAYDWQKSFENNLQYAIAAAAAEFALPKRIEEFYVHGLGKGSRTDHDISPTGKVQNSPFCYAYINYGSAPLWENDIKVQYSWIDKDTGRNRKLGATYRKIPAWKLDLGNGLPDIYSAESVVRHASSYYKLLVDQEVPLPLEFLGPIDYRADLVDEFLVEFESNERRWYDDLGRLPKTSSLVDPVVQNALARLFPRTWQCRSFGESCQFVPICYKHDGWDDPLGGSKYSTRIPNHPMEPV